MNKLGKFAILRYIPNENREEFINIGLVFHLPTEGYVNFRATTNFSRVTKFDDEIDIDFLKLVLSGVESEFTQDLVHGPSDKMVSDTKFLEKQTAHYANQLQFSPIRIIRTNDPVKDFENLFKTYVYFDAKKNQRISEAEVKTIMNRVFEKSMYIDKLSKDYSLNLGSENVTFDYVYESKENRNKKFIKALSFDYSPRMTRLATQVAKEWAWNYLKIGENSDVNNKITKEDLLTVVYLKDSDNNVKTAIEILEENSNTITVNNEKRVEEFANNIMKDIK